MKKRIIAINLPQYHPFKENDEWWGKGFTEWTNVTKAKPRYHGHYQPHLPTETGFYDLRLPEARQMQADMARQYGIYGFCYYHYWFNGHQLMERPINDILESKKPDFPFMLCWANENWSRNWDGGYKKILIEQNYNKEDDIAHMDYLCENVFLDSRYIRINGKPVFAVYKPFLFPNIKETIATWREVAKKYNFELYLIASNFGYISSKQATQWGFDALFDFQPINAGNFRSYKYNPISVFKKKILHKIFPHLPIYYSYKKYISYQIKRPLISESEKIYPCVSPGWDNSPRRVGQTFFAYKGNTPSLYYKWLKTTLKRFIPFSKDENLVFINAWNEWAEGNHLEPDIKWGKQFLEATKKAIDEENI